MKKKLLSMALLLGAFTIHAQVVTHTVTMGAGSGNNVFYKINTQSETSFNNNDWDLAFYRDSSRQKGIRINDGKGLTLHEVSNNINDWNTVSIGDVSDENALYNSDITWADGAFDAGSAQFGWGVYNISTHAVTGSVVFIIKYPNNQFKKVKINSFLGGYNFTYANWDGAAWGPDITQELPNTANANNYFNYFNLNTNAAVIAEAEKTAWDLEFTKYTGDVPTFDGTLMKYVVTGVLHNPNVTVAKSQNRETGAFSEEINAIGYNWKTFNGADYSVDSATNYFVKYADATVYKLNFQSFSGTSTGTTVFTTEDVTASLSTSDPLAQVQFGVFPNPSTNKRVNLLLDLKNTDAAGLEVQIFNTNGGLVHQEQYTDGSGFYNRELDLSKLSSGIYLVKIQSGSYGATKKLILN